MRFLSSIEPTLSGWKRRSADILVLCVFDLGRFDNSADM